MERRPFGRVSTAEAAAAAIATGPDRASSQGSSAGASGVGRSITIRDSRQVADFGIARRGRVGRRGGAKGVIRPLPGPGLLGNLLVRPEFFEAEH